MRLQPLNTICVGAGASVPFFCGSAELGAVFAFCYSVGTEYAQEELMPALEVGRLHVELHREQVARSGFADSGQIVADAACAHRVFITTVAEDTQRFATE